MMLESLFNIRWVVGSFNSLLHESVVDNVQINGCSGEICGSSISQLPVEEIFLFNWILWNVSWEDVFRSIDISAEFEIVDFSDVSSV